MTVVYNWLWRQEVWIKTAVQINLSGATSWPTVLNNLENSGSGKNIMTSDGQHIWTDLLTDFFFLFAITLCSNNVHPPPPCFRSKPGTAGSQDATGTVLFMFWTSPSWMSCTTAAKFKKYSRIKRHYLFQQRCHCCFEPDFNCCSHL